MKVTILENSSKETEIIIRCDKITDEILLLAEKIRNSKDKISVYDENMETTLILIEDILYCEYVDRSVYLYTIDKMYKTNLALIQLEENYLPENFIRCSKSFIVNINFIEKFKSELSGRLIATLENNEQIYISRHYVKLFKKKLNDMR